jgi:hypothetical protein
MQRKTTWLILALLLLPLLLASCAQSEKGTTDQASDTTTASEIDDEFELWTEGTLLRGANIYQKKIIPELDGTTFAGPGPVGPPYTQADIEALAALGANYVQISHPGLYTENPPYVLDQGIQDNLDDLLDMITEAGMYAVIAFRTGPGRSEFTFFWEEVGTWFDESYLNDSVWEDQEAQDAWVEMWRHTAEHYSGHPAVVGYELMVEPNSNDRLLDIWEPEEFYQEYAGTLYDWNQLFPRITTAIREVDPETPLMVGGNGYSSVEWLPYLQPSGDPRTTYVIHQYAPHEYTHQEPDGPTYTYLGALDVDYDEEDDILDKSSLDHLLSTVDTFVSMNDVPIAVTEFGLVRWAPGAGQFMDDLMDLFEERGWNHALWVWNPSWEEWNEEVDAFNLMHGPDPNNHSDVESSDLIEAIKNNWAHNTI